MLQAALAGLAAGAICSLASATTIFSSGDPFGPQGVSGTEIFAGQGAAIRFTPERDCTLSSCSLWIMSSAPEGEEIAPLITVSVREDGDTGQAAGPGEAALESWSRGISAVGPAPVLEVFTSADGPVLHAGRRYWLVAEAATASGRSPVWARSQGVSGTVAVRGGAGSSWEVGSAPALAAAVEGRTIGCGSADFDGDGSPATDSDLEAFLACLAGSCCAACDPLGADFNNDGDPATDSDLEAFFRVMAGGPC